MRLRRPKVFDQLPEATIYPDVFGNGEILPGSVNILPGYVAVRNTFKDVLWSERTASQMRWKAECDFGQTMIQHEFRRSMLTGMVALDVDSVTTTGVNPPTIDQAKLWSDRGQNRTVVNLAVANQRLSPNAIMSTTYVVLLHTTGDSCSPPPTSALENL